MRIAGQASTRQILSSIESRVELRSQVGIGRQLLAGIKLRVALIELRFQHSQAFELGKEETGGLACWPKRVVHVILLIRGKLLLGASEVEVVHQPETIIQR